jgi:hypothetical protein
MGEIMTLKEAYNYMVNILNMDIGEATDVMLDDRLKILPEQVCGKVCINTNNLEEVIKLKNNG